MTTASSPASESADAVVSVGDRYRSERYAYTWQLPPGWEFIPPQTVWVPPTSEGVDILVARVRNAARPVAVLIVMDVVSVIPGKLPRLDAEQSRLLEDHATFQLKAGGADEFKTERVRVLDTEAIRVSGVREGWGAKTVDATLFFKGRRRFEVWCVAKTPGSTPASKCPSGSPVSPVVLATTWN